MRITTWNINSVRLRLDGLRRLDNELRPDVLCLQEIKVESEKFPRTFAYELGFKHCFVYGQKAYNGVAILSRIPFANTEKKSWVGKDDARHVYVTLRLPGKQTLEVHNFYVPSGGDEPDPHVNKKFRHKLSFLEEMSSWFAERQHPQNRFILVGDLNVAPLETDVWSHRQLLKVVSHTPAETNALMNVMASHSWIDTVRHFKLKNQKIYSWWSYRAKNWASSDRGRRLDHIWATPALEKFLSGASILRNARAWPKPSDHVPVTVDLALKSTGS